MATRVGGTALFEDLFSPAKLLVILVVALFLFGPQRLPEIGRNLGRAIREFQDAFGNVKNALRQSGEQQERPPEPD